MALFVIPSGLTGRSAGILIAILGGVATLLCLWRGEVAIGGVLFRRKDDPKGYWTNVAIFAGVGVIGLAMALFLA